VVEGLKDGMERDELEEKTKVRISYHNGSNRFLYWTRCPFGVLGLDKNELVNLLRIYSGTEKEAVVLHQKRYDELDNLPSSTKRKYKEMELIFNERDKHVYAYHVLIDIILKLEMQGLKDG